MNAQDDGRVRCPRCGAEYQPQTPGGVCPACAFAAALSAPPAEGGGDRLFLRLYKFTWENPRADLAIERLDFQSENPHCSPFLLAITVE
jgi:hypothetical protein